MFSVFRKDAEILNKQYIGTEQLILIEGVSCFNYIILYHDIN